MFSLIQENIPNRSRPIRMRKKMKRTMKIFIANFISFQKIKMRIMTPIKIIHRGMSERNSIDPPPSVDS